MNDKSKIPDKLYQDLVEEFGEEKAEQLIDKYEYIGLMKKLAANRLSQILGFKISWWMLIIIILSFLGLFYYLTEVSY